MDERLFNTYNVWKSGGFSLSEGIMEKEKEKTGILVGRFEVADIIEEGKTKIYLLPHWMI